MAEESKPQTTNVDAKANDAVDAKANDAVDAKANDAVDAKANDAASSASSEVIDLEGLVRDIDLTPTPVPGQSSGPAVSSSNASEAPRAEVMADDFTPAPQVPEAPLHAEEISIEKFDEILKEEDPELAAQFEAIRAEGFSDASDTAVPEIELLEQEDAAVGAALRGKSRMSFRERIQFRLLKLRSLVRAGRVLVARAAKDFKGVLREVGIRSKVAILTEMRNRKAKVANAVSWLKARTRGQKLAIVASLAASGALVFIAVKTVRGTLLPKTEKVWISDFANRADGVFKYDVNGPSEDFNDPLLHPEFVVLIERVVVNLARSPEASENAIPMAAFELYLQTDNQDAAIEIKDRSVEIRDALSRSVERMTYASLAEEEGKTKLKLLIRRDLNQLMTRGKVRRVFFKTLVLNPE